MTSRPRPRSRLVALAVVAAVATTVTAVVTGVPAGTASAASARAQWGVAEEQAFVGRINQLRASRGLPTLTVDPELQTQARIWAGVMRDRGHIFHTDDLPAGVTSDWQKLGENVGVGGSVDSLFAAFVASPTHYDNLVDPAYRFVGVGVVWDGDRMFTTHRFMSLRAPAPAPVPSSPQAPPPDELAAVDPPAVAPPPTTPEPPAPAPAPADPVRIGLVLAALAPVLD